MADIRCPMCGKTNPAGASTCQYCHAQLSPMGEQSPAAQPPAGSSAGEEGVPDWLSQLRNDDSSNPSWNSPPEGGVEPGSQSESGDADLPDWLARIRHAAPEDESGPSAMEGLDGQGEAETGAASPGDIPDWLQSISPHPAKEPDASAEDKPSLEDWLSKLDSMDQQPSEPPASVPEPSATSKTPSGTGELDNDEWLKSFQGWSSNLENPSPTSEGTPGAPMGGEGVDSAWYESTPGHAATGPLDQDFTEWLADLPQELPPAAGEPTGGTAEIPDFLSNAAAGAAAATAASKMVEPGAGTPPSQPMTPQAGDETVPDWLSALPSEPSAGGEPPSAPAGEEAVPDWLSALPTEPSMGAAGLAAAETPSAGKEPVPGGEESAPDWLSALPTAGAVVGAAALVAKSDQTMPEAAPEEDLDWLRSLGEVETPTPETGTSSSEIPQEEPSAEPTSTEETPDWLAAFAGAAFVASQDQAPMPAAETPPASTETPDWLSSFDTEAATGVTGEAAPASEVPDWLGAFAVEGAAAAETPAAAAETPPVEQDKGPGLGTVLGGLAAGAMVAGMAHKDSEQTPAGTQPGPGVTPFAGEDLPEWLDQTSVPAEAVEGEAAAEVSPLGEELVPAQMPGWLQAMRPVEAAVVASSLVEEGPTEKVGPLAGMQGTLPAVDLRRQYRKPPVYSMKLKVTEKQHADADLLREMLASEGEPLVVAQAKTQTPQRLLRFILGLILISILLFSAIFASGMPTNITPAPQVSAVNDHVEALAAGSPVLLVADYEPGFSGEIDFAAYGLIQHLMQKKIRLAVVSTLPSGPVLGADLLARAYADLNKSPAGSGGYTLDTWTANLGYLPGGIVSLQEFARSPQQALRYGFTSDINGQSVWDQPALQGVQKLSDFAMVIVLTSNADNGRAWVEQVLPSLGAAPLVFVGSAQSGPLLRPYVNQNQAAGLISGYTGGMTYLQLAKVSVDHAYKWYVAYRAGLLMGVVFILMGLFYQVIVFLGSQRKA